MTYIKTIFLVESKINKKKDSAKCFLGILFVAGKRFNL